MKKILSAVLVMRSMVAGDIMETWERKKVSAYK